MKERNLIYRVYSNCLHLYPYSFKEIYQEEMLGVFDEQITSGGSILAKVKLCLREIRDLPFALFNAHLNSRRMPPMKTLNRWFIHQEGSWQEILLALMPYLLLALFPNILMLIPLSANITNPVIGISIVLVLFIILATLGIIGLLVRLPRWAMPYAGMLVGVVSLAAPVAVSIVFDLGEDATWWLGVLFVLCLFVVIQVVFFGICFWLAWRLPFIQDFYQMMKRDHAIISFAMYGSASLMVLLHFEDLPNSQWYGLVCSVSMIVSTWGFLRAKNQSVKMNWLMGGITVSSIIALITNLALWKLPTSAMFYIGTIPIERSFYFVGLTWLVSMLIIQSPAWFVPYLPEMKSALAAE